MLTEYEAATIRRSRQSQPQNQLLREGGPEMHPANWEKLADRSIPLPEHLNRKKALHVMSQYLMGLIELADEQRGNGFF